MCVQRPTRPGSPSYTPEGVPDGDGFTDGASQLQDIIGQLTRQTAPAPLPTPEVTPTFPMPLIGAGSKLAPPARYAGEPEQSRIFFIDCSIHFE